MSVRKIKWFFFVASIWILNTIDDINANIVEAPVDTEVRVGDSTYLNCSISDASGEVSWFHYPVGKGAHDLRYVYANKQVFEPYNRRFLIEKNPSTGSFNLVITQVEVQDAGSYVCDDGRKTVTSQLIILESTPDCKSNINSSGFVGPNVCGLQKETIQLSCAINYTGNIAPMLQWTRLKQDNWLNVPQSSCSVFNGRITCNYTTEADTQLDESVFICHSNRSRNPKDNCKTETVKILYAFTTDNQMEKAVGETVTCVANTNSVCWNYTWFYSDGAHHSVVSRSQSLSLENVGWYRCDANCSIKGQECSYTTMTVNVDAKTETAVSHLYAIIVALCSIIVIIVALIILFKILKKRRRWEEKQPCPKRHGCINPQNEHLLKCKTEPLVYINKPKFMHKFNMETNGKDDKAIHAIHGIAVLRDMLYVVRKDCEEIEVFSMKGYKYKESIKVENLLCPFDIISHEANNYLFIDDNKDGKKYPDEIIRITPKEDVGKKCRWPIADEKKLRIEVGRLSLTYDGNILIPLINEMRLREYDCDGNLKREIEILPPYITYKNIRQVILLKSGNFVLSFGDGASEENQGVFIGKMEGQKLKCIQDDTPSNEDDKPEINIPSHTITIDDLSILVADRKNRRVLLFHVKDTSEAKPGLEFQRELLSKKNGLNKLYRLYLDKTSGCLFVADNEKIKVNGEKKDGNGRILVYSVI